MMCLWASYEKKYEKNSFLCIFKNKWKKESDPKLNPDPESDPDPFVSSTDLGIRIRTKIKRIPNTVKKVLEKKCCLLTKNLSIF